jgi:enoyl-CoA hydratase/carnithine racemase
MAYDLLETSDSDGHVNVTLANPDKPNPINGQLQRELDAVLDDVEADDSTTVLSITGQGGSFAVGADIGEMHGWFRNEEWDELMRFLRDGQRLMTRVSDLPVTTVAGVNGYALGGGLELALACDLRFASASATLGFPEVDLGMIPGWGGTQRLPRVVGQSAAKDLLLTGRHVDADEALDIGLVDRVVDDGGLDDAVDEYAATLAEKPAHTMQYMLEAVETGATGPIETGLSYELMCDMLASFSDETAARVEAFVEKQ